jgi:hypothetical protein
MTTAQEYAATIAEELREWRRAINDTDGGTAYRKHAEEHLPGDGTGEPFTWADYLEACALEVVALREINGDRLRVEVLRTYGGPGCRIVYDGGNYLTVTAYVMGEPSVSRDVFAPELCQWFDDVYGGQS